MPVENEPKYMWPYYSAEYGTADALKDYYPETVKKNAQLKVALAQIKSSEATIETIMSEYADREPLC